MVHFRSLFVIFKLSFTSVLHVALNSFSKCSNVLSTAWYFISNKKSMIMGKISIFITKCRAKQGINFGATFCIRRWLEYKCFINSKLQAMCGYCMTVIISCSLLQKVASYRGQGRRKGDFGAATWFLKPGK